MQQTAAELAVLLDGNVKGNPDVRVRRLAKIESAGPGSVSFLANPEYERFIYNTEASIVIVSKTFEASEPLPEGLTLLRVEDPYRAFARLLEAYDAVLKRQEEFTPPPWSTTTPCWAKGVLGTLRGHRAWGGHWNRVELRHAHVGRDAQLATTASFTVARKSWTAVW